MKTLKKSLIRILIAVGILLIAILSVLLLFGQNAESKSSIESTQVSTPTETPQISEMPPTSVVPAEPEVQVQPNEMPELSTPEELLPEIPEEPAVNTESTEPELKLLNEFTITYYCSCKKCCGKWANNRPVIDGKEVVYTASGVIAEAGVTVAVDPSKIDYGTELYIEGLGYRVAQDCGGSIKGNRIDVYMDNHEAALEAGKHTAQVYLVIK